MNEEDKPDNGESAPALPELTIAWDQEKQIAYLKLDTNEFKTWEYVLMVLEAGKLKAQENLNLCRMANAQQMVAQAAQAQEVERRLFGGLDKPPMRRRLLGP